MSDVTVFMCHPRVAKKFMDVLKDTEVFTHSDYTSKSRNYKLGVAYEDMQAGVQGSLFFDPSSKLPREVLLQTTLKAFGFNMDVWEVCQSKSHDDHLYCSFITKLQVLTHYSHMFFNRSACRERGLSHLSKLYLELMDFSLILYPKFYTGRWIKFPNLKNGSKSQRDTRYSI